MTRLGSGRLASVNTSWTCRENFVGVTNVSMTFESVN